MNQKKIPLGVSDFKALTTGDFIYCDKTLMLKEFLNYGQQVTFLNKAHYNKDILSQISNFMHYFFSLSLKENEYLERAFLTGVLKMSKNSMLSGLNNIAVITLLNFQYSGFYGFSKEETISLMSNLILYCC